MRFAIASSPLGCGSRTSTTMGFCSKGASRAPGAGGTGFAISSRKSRRVPEALSTAPDARGIPRNCAHLGSEIALVFWQVLGELRNLRAYREAQRTDRRKRHHDRGDHRRDFPYAPAAQLSDNGCKDKREQRRDYKRDKNFAPNVQEPDDAAGYNESAGQAAQALMQSLDPHDGAKSHCTSPRTFPSASSAATATTRDRAAAMARHSRSSRAATHVSIGFSLTGFAISR